MPRLTRVLDDYGFFDAEEMQALGRSLAADYQAAEPFPHTVIDEFMSPAMLDVCLRDFPDESAAEHSYDRDQERYKTSYNPDTLSAPVRSLFYAFNSAPFLGFLEALTGIDGLIPDPYFEGGGFHNTSTGGHLSVHADFNFHKKLKLERRINVLVYLNRNWQLEHGGAFELWDVEMKKCWRKVEPVFNRCAIFNTSSWSYHGAPDPVAHPDGLPRRSIALYYYTATFDETKRAHTTQYQVRPDSEDRKDWQVWSRELALDWTPPALRRLIARRR